MLIEGGIIREKYRGRFPVNARFVKNKYMAEIEKNRGKLLKKSNTVGVKKIIS